MILMDQRRIARFKGRLVQTAHLMSDLPGEAGTAELDAFARRIGIRTKWRQNSGTETEHYDLFGSRLDQAADAGAVVVTGRELIERVVFPKRKARTGGVPS